MTLDRDILLFYALDSFSLGFNADALGISQVLGCYATDRRWHSGREERTLTGVWRLRENGFNVVDKTHTQHFVGFI